jgi:hypothetical protein
MPFVQFRYSGPSTARDSHWPSCCIRNLQNSDESAKTRATLHSPPECGLPRRTCFSQLVRRTEFALSQLPRRPTNFSGFAAAGVRARSRTNSSSCDWLVPRPAEIFRGRYEWPEPKCELRLPDKLKAYRTVRYAQTLSGHFSFQLLSGMKSSRVQRIWRDSNKERGRRSGACLFIAAGFGILFEGCRGLLAGGSDVESFSARAAMAWNFPQAFHKEIGDPPGHRGSDIHPLAAGASHFARLNVEVLLNLQTGSLPEPRETVDSRLCGMLGWRSCEVY